MLEKTVKAAVRKRLKELGCYQFWPVPTGLGETTVDILGCYRGRFIAVETKAPGKVPTERQKFVLEQIRKAGGMAFVIDSIEAANELFKDE